MNVKLTGEERRVLLAHLEEQWADPAIPVTITRAVVPAVERIVAARLAAAWDEGCDAGWVAAQDVAKRIDRPTNPYTARADRAVSSEAPA